MANVLVIQRHAHFAGPVRLEYVNGREGQIAKGVVTIISNARRGRGSEDEQQEESTAIQWTLWGKQAAAAAAYLGKGSHVNVVGRLKNNNYEKDGETIYGMTFTVEELDYLDTRAEGEARRERKEQGDPGGQEQRDEVSAPPPRSDANRKAARSGGARRGSGSDHAAA